MGMLWTGGKGIGREVATKVEIRRKVEDGRKKGWKGIGRVVMISGSEIEERSQVRTGFQFDLFSLAKRSVVLK